MSKKIRHVQDSDQLSSDIVSQPTKELERRLELLEWSISHLANKGTIANVVISDKECSSDVELYNTVYYNNVSGLYERAIAKVNFTGSNFTTLSSSLVTGIVVKKVGSSIDILVDGTWPVAAMSGSGNLLESGQSFQAGKPYYLSSSEYGRITFRPPSLAIQVAMMSDTDLIMNKVYGSPEGFETSSKYEMGMRPVGGLVSKGNKKRIVGFHALESSDGIEWDLTSNGGTYDQSGYMVAEGSAHEFIDTPIFLEIKVEKNSGNIITRTASSLENLSAGTTINEDTYSDATENTENPFKVTVANCESVRTLKILNSSGREIYTMHFKFSVNHGETFELDSHRVLIFEVPNSLVGWKELDASDIDAGLGSRHQIKPYYAAASDCDYPDYPHIPSQGSLYYSTKSDFSFVGNWPPEPLDKTILMMNGVELLNSNIIEDGASSKFKDEKSSVGASIKTLYWTTKFASTQPWDSIYSQLTLDESSAHNLDSRLSHLEGPGGKIWHWTEKMHSFEPYLNKGWVYSNKLNVYNKSSKVLGVGVMPPLKIRDTLTGLEPSYEGEPITGNLLVWSDDKSNIVHQTNEIPLGRMGITPLYTNTGKFSVVIKEILITCTEQNGAQLSNEDLGKSFTSDDSAKINLGTGLEGSTSENIVKERLTNVSEYNTYSVMTIDDGAAVIPPGGVLRLHVFRSFPVSQTVSVIVFGRII